MRLIDLKDEDFLDQLSAIRGGLLPEKILFDAEDTLNVVHGIIRQIRQSGDRGLLELTKKYDEIELRADELRVSNDQLEQASNALEPDLQRALMSAIENVRRYQQHIKAHQHLSLVRAGIELTTRYRPLGRVGICVPGAAAPLPSSLIMTVVPAQVAGVSELAVVSPPRYQGDVHPVILGLCRMLGIDEVYRVGGAQAVAALALGTETIKPVDKIVGPGNLYVQLAKKVLFGVVDIDSFAGPSEIVVLADEDANPRYVAADLIGQAEHDPGSAILITPSRKLAQAVFDQMEALLKRSERAEATRRCLEKYSAAIISESLDQAIDLVNQLAPEHLSVQTAQPELVTEKCIHAGAIFVGPFTSEALGDYVAGPSHVLPTGGTARAFSPLNVMDFMRHTSVIKYDRTALKEAYAALKELTTAEGLPGHLLSATVRLED